MKTDVLIPDPLFEQAEALATKLRLSRDELFVKALSAFLREHHDAQITAQLNQVYSQRSSAIDPVLARMQALSLPAEEW
jgi:hypothetical protein